MVVRVPIAAEALIAGTLATADLKVETIKSQLRLKRSLLGLSLFCRRKGGKGGVPIAAEALIAGTPLYLEAFRLCSSQLRLKRSLLGLCNGSTGRVSFLQRPNCG